MTKIAFCFLSYSDVVHKDRWLSFFNDISFDNYSVHIHRSDGIKETYLPNSSIIDTIPTKWGKFSLVEAQHLLFKDAFKNPTVKKAILLSGDSIPIYKDFLYIYNIFTKDEMGYMQFSSNNMAKDHYTREPSVNKEKWPENLKWTWTVSSQWCVLNRSHFDLLDKNFVMLTNVFKDSIVPDEHTYPVFFTGVDQLHTFHQYSHMFVNWKKTTATRCLTCSKIDKLPRIHHTEDITPEYIDRVYKSNQFFIRKLCKTCKTDSFDR
jgi:hypothetical protein